MHLTNKCDDKADIVGVKNMTREDVLWKGSWGQLQRREIINRFKQDFNESVVGG